MEPVISYQNVTKMYGAQIALHDVIDRTANEGCSEIHQFVVNIFGIVCVKDLHFFAMQHQSSVNFVI